MSGAAPKMIDMRHTPGCNIRSGGMCSCPVQVDAVAIQQPKPIRDQLERELNKAFNWHTSERIMALLEVFIEEKMRGN